MGFARSTFLRFAALVFLLQIVGAALLLATVHQLTADQIGDEAEAHAEQLRDQLLGSYRQGGFAALGAAVAARTQPGRAPGAAVLLVDRGGRPVAGNIAEWPPSLPSSSAAATIDLFRIGHDESEQIYLVATPLAGGGRLLTGHVVESELRFAVILEEAMVSAFAVAVALAAFAAWSSTRLIHGRLAATVGTARAVTAGNLDHRVPVDGGDDAFDALGATINAMLDRIAALMAELKIATDGLAHDLRSPLTRLRSTLERALDASEGEEAKGAVARAIDEGDRLLTMLDTALRISRAEAGIGRESFVDTDLSAMVEDMVEVYGPLAEDNGFAIVADAPAGIRGHVHRELLGQALANLIDNAMKYGAGRIVVAARRTRDGAVVSVGDDGPGIAENQRPEALRRFGRLDAARSKAGAGLGLALASAVARLHDGALELHDNGPGLRVELHLGPGISA
ncbi:MULTISPECIES: sensor histidine kinase [unclassified Sphingomonas]|uniref:sensor histidine kinase n=1 Tax=unclassified Sphingomonas TaxID=196159 RepID=UPI0006F84A54|nr:MULTISPECIES: HAMP domain-containing sensor histidine kinase [unclassified Sphingomonas]KQX19507.1 histidine kinase [Sphingomonas sp. Root1294]KQY65708.1 histidine kinase [Sphingomonas sp. Root50]KRB94988.1 histidine kinase [Sphingomonas sp. Root720]